VNGEVLPLVLPNDATLRQDKEQIETALTSLRLTEERWRAMTPQTLSRS